MKKKILSILLTLVMVIGMLPTVAVAATPARPTGLRWDGNVAKWDAVEGAEEIRIILKCSENPDRSTNNFSIVENITLSGTATEYDWSDYLNPGVTYCFTVVADYGETSKNDVSEKKTAAGSIGTIEANWVGSMGDSNIPAVTWEPVDGAAYYCCQVINGDGKQVGEWIDVTDGTLLDLTELVNFHGTDDYSVYILASSVPYSGKNWMAKGSVESQFLKGSPYASIEEDEISGTLNQQVYGQSITITLTSDTFKESLSGNWITNLPAGLSQSVTRTSDTQAKITITGIPTSQSHDYVEVTIPANMLNGGTEIVVKPNSIYSVAKFNITSYFTVTYKDGANGDFFPYRLYICEYGAATPKFPYTPWEKGYDFMGWSPSVADTVTANAVYTATWEAKDYKVTFYLADIPSVAVKYGQKYTLPEPADDPDDNKVFKGWQRGDQVLQPGDTITIDGDMGFYAQWEYVGATQYTVVFTDGTDDENVFASNSAANDAGDLVYACDKNSKTPNPYPTYPPSRDGYTFKGWSPSLSDTVTQNVVYTAQWEPNTYTIYFMHGAYTSDMKSVEVKYGSQFEFPVYTGTLYTKEIFKYWTVGNSETKYYPGQTITIDETVIPGTGSEIKVKTNTVYGKTLTISGGTANGKTGELLFAPGEKIEIVATPEQGYKFQEWGSSVEIEGFNTAASSTLLVMPEQDIAIEAVFEQYITPVTYPEFTTKPQGGAVEYGKTLNVTWETNFTPEKIEIHYMAKTGSTTVLVETLDGTSTSASLSPREEPYIIAAYYKRSNGDLNWIISNPFKITEKSREIDTVEINITAPVVGLIPSYSVSVPNDAGYEIHSKNDSSYTNGICWKKYENDTTTVMAATDKFEVGKTYIFTVLIEPKAGYEFYYAEGSTSTEPDVTVTVNGKAAEFNKDSSWLIVQYTFIGGTWENADTNKYTVIFTDGVDNEEVFKSHPQSNAVGDIVYTCDKDSATPSPFNSDPSRDGYTFKGWSPSLSATVTENVMYTAQWEPNTYTIEFYKGAWAAGMESVEVKYGSQFEFPEFTGTLNNNEVFMYWTVGSSEMKYYPGDTIAIDNNVVPNTGSSIKVKANVAYGKTLSISGGTANGKTGELLFAPGEEITIVATPEHGYKFQAWNVTDLYGDTLDLGFDTFSSSALFVMPNQNISIEAVFEEVVVPAAPVASVADGTNFATDDMAVAITCADPDADIYVALYGNDPRLAASSYRWKWTNGESIYMGRNYDADFSYDDYTFKGNDVSLKIASVKDGVWSDVVTYTYHKIGSGEMAAPTATPGSASFNYGGSITVSLKSDVVGAVIKYSRNGGEELTYNGPITISSTTELTVWAVTAYSGLKNYLSDKTTYTYTEKVTALTGSTTDGIKVEVKDLIGSATLMVAQYNGGKMVDVEMKTVSADGTYNFTELAHKTGCTYKAFLVNSTSYVPLCAAKPFS